MIRLYLGSSVRALGLVLHALCRLPSASTASFGRRLLFLLVFPPAFLLLQVFHLVGLLLDDLLFPAYRRVPVRQPVFILGIPRSGTTRLHRTLARDPAFTTFRSWEAWFALSITTRRILRGLAAFDRRLGGPAHQLLRRLEQRLASGLDHIHPTGLHEAEEDYFIFLPVLACFILILPFPEATALWRLTRFQRDLSPGYRRRLLQYYTRCLQRHLYVHGTQKCFLSKNASFSPLLQDLADTFPDARFILCVRDPAHAVPSQLSAIADGFRSFGVHPASAGVHDRMLHALRGYYEQMGDALTTLPPHRCAVVTMPELKNQLAPTLHRLHQTLDLPLSDHFLQTLQPHHRQGQTYRSRHRYHLRDFDLTPQSLREFFAAAYARFSFDPPSPVGENNPPAFRDSDLSPEGTGHA